MCAGSLLVVLGNFMELLSESCSHMPAVYVQLDMHYIPEQYMAVTILLDF